MSLASVLNKKLTDENAEKVTGGSGPYVVNFYCHTEGCTGSSIETAWDSKEHDFIRNEPHKCDKCGAIMFTWK